MIHALVFFKAFTYYFHTTLTNVVKSYSTQESYFGVVRLNSFRPVKYWICFFRFQKLKKNRAV